MTDCESCLYDLDDFLLILLVVLVAVTICRYYSNDSVYGGDCCPAESLGYISHGGTGFIPADIVDYSGMPDELGVSEV